MRIQFTYAAVSAPLFVAFSDRLKSFSHKGVCDMQRREVHNQSLSEHTTDYFFFLTIRGHDETIISVENYAPTGSGRFFCSARASLRNACSSFYLRKQKKSAGAKAR
jgi:hypothetical protein